MAENKDKVLATSVDAISPELLESIKAQAIADAKADAEKDAEAKANAAVENERARVAKLKEYASLPQPEIKALAEKAIADGMSFENFKAQYDEIAFDALKNATQAKTPIAEEAQASSEIGAVNTGNQTNDDPVAKAKADADAIIKARGN